MNNQEAKKIFEETFPQRKPEKIPDCGCGWNGQVDWQAHGQKCPKCGQSLT